MCGRFSLKTPPADLAAHFGLAEVPNLEARYNVAPSQDIAVVRASGSTGRHLVSMRWGLIPYGAKDPAVGARMINARAETAASKPVFRWSFQKARCLVPADGFFEWKAMEGPKQPYYLQLDPPRLFAFAGLWDRWISPQGEETLSCTILTTEPIAVVRPIHDRMPVILAPEVYDTWLNADAPADELVALLRPSESRRMVVQAVSSIVNAPRNDSPACIEPVPEPLELDLFGDRPSA